MDLSTFYNQFSEETTENVRTLHSGLLALETLTDPSQRKAELDHIFRAVHTIKGSARMLGFEGIGRLAHAIEFVLDDLRRDRRTLERELADLLLAGGDALLSLTQAATTGEPAPLDIEALLSQLQPAETVGTPAPAAPAPAPPPSPMPTPAVPVATPASAPAERPASRQTVRVRVDRLDRMLNLAGELVVSQQVFGHHLEYLHALEQINQQQAQALAALTAELARLRFSTSQRQMLDQRIKTLEQTHHDARNSIQRQYERFERNAGQHEQLVRDLEQEVMSARLLPIATVYTGLPRAVRDLAATTGKALQLELHGETTELDRKILELINDPLLHLVRNAADHGIEPPDVRQALGKSSTGTISVRAEATGGDVQVIISDDGRGIDPQRLRDRAVQLGMLTPDAAARLSTAEALDLVFLPGLTTAASVSSISGRGVGMDVVRANITELGGQVRIESQPGHGTQIVLSLPLTLVTTRVLLVRVGRTTLALPATGCRGVLWVHTDAIQLFDGRPTLNHDGATIGVQSLAAALGITSEQSHATRRPAILLGTRQRTIAYTVDALLDEREVVVKPLGPLFAAQRGYSGAVQLGDGSLVLLLNPAALAQTGTTDMRTAPIVSSPRRRRLLVVDDSFTTRELIRSILAAAGYDVQAAVDGTDALDKLRAHPYDLVVSDVEMPRLDGLGLTTQIRSDPQLDTLPVVLITSLASDAHRRRGLEAGAQAYIVKSQFNQDGLLEVIQQLLGYEG
jgi:two-component system chemotaxis sensor kinase CheA